jgi:hypothetical protein
MQMQFGFRESGDEIRCLHESTPASASSPDR